MADEKQGKHNFHQVIPTHILIKHLKDKLAQTDVQLRHSFGETSVILKGQALCLESLLNLPESLTMLEDSDASNDPKD